MDHVRWVNRPGLRQPVLLAAFEGWNDAGDAATGAVRWLRRHWDLQRFATIDPEEFFDFTTQRPQVTLEGGTQRRIRWPEWRLAAGRIPDTDIDVITLVGPEPALRWRTFCQQVTGLTDTFGCSLAVTVGALLAEVSHARPVEVIGTAYDPAVVQRLDLRPSTYQGPTGIVGVLHDALSRTPVPSASLWAAVPGYAPGVTSPKATLALVQRVSDLLGVSTVTTDLEVATAAYERQMAEAVAADDDMAGYVSRIEESADGGARFGDDEDDDEAEEAPGPSFTMDEARGFVDEVERFLRDQRGEG